MWSRTFALFLRSLRVDARLLQSHLMRLGLLSFVIVNLLWSQLISVAMGAPGLYFFQFITWVNFLFATFAGFLLFSTAITEEKEEQTLGLLQMANVSRLSLLVGKLAPRLLAALLILAVQFPFTLLAITLGGVSWHQVFAAFWTLFAHVVLMGMLGLFSSVVCRRSGTAVVLTISLVLLAVLLPLFSYIYFSQIPAPVYESAWAQLAHEWGAVASARLIENTAGWRLMEILRTGFDEPAFGSQVWSNLAAGGLLLGLSWATFDLFNRNVDAASVQSRRVLSLLTGRRRNRSRRAWAFPIVWREFVYGAGGYTAWIAKMLVYGPTALLILLAVEDWRLSRVDVDDFGTLVMGLMLYLAIPIESVWLAARTFRSEIKEKTWTALTSLPLSLPEIAYPKVAGCALALAPALFYLVLGGMLDLQTILDFADDVLDEPTAIVAIANVIAHFILVLHLAALYSILSNTWVGLLLTGLTWAIGTWAMYLCLMLPMILMSMGGGPFGPGGGIDPEDYITVAYGLAAILLLGLSALLHWSIGSRLKAAAANS